MDLLLGQERRLSVFPTLIPTIPPGISNTSHDTTQARDRPLLPGKLGLGIEVQAPHVPAPAIAITDPLGQLAQHPVSDPLAMSSVRILAIEDAVKVLTPLLLGLLHVVSKRV